MQDNSPDKQAQLDGMGDIFAGAFVTIIAATGSDADQGLTGVPGVTSSPNLLGRRDSEHDELDFDNGGGITCTTPEMMTPVPS